MLKSANLLHKCGLGDSDMSSTVAQCPSLYYSGCYRRRRLCRHGGSDGGSRRSVDVSTVALRAALHCLCRHNSASSLSWWVKLGFGGFFSTDSCSTATSEPCLYLRFALATSLLAQSHVTLHVNTTEWDYIDNLLCTVRARWQTAVSIIFSFFVCLVSIRAVVKLHTGISLFSFL